MKRRQSFAAMGAAVAAVVFPGLAHAAYPERPITLIVPWGAGGGTDAVARIIAAELEKELKQPINVVNRTGGSGVVGHQAIASAAPDGYTLGILTVEIGMMRHAGLTQLSGTDYTPLALMNFDANAVFVRTDSPDQEREGTARRGTRQSRQDEGQRHRPGRHLAPGRSPAWLVDDKLPGNAIAWVPSQGAAPGLQDLVAGGVDVVSCSLPEARSLIDADKVRPLILLASKPDGIFPKVPLYTTPTGKDVERRRVARHRRPEGPAGGRERPAREHAQEDLRRQGLPGLPRFARLRRALCRSHGVRQVHGREGRQLRGRDEGSRHRQVTRRDAHP